MKEIWKDAVGFDGYLKVSNMGRCITMGRYTRNIYGDVVYKKPALLRFKKGRYSLVSLVINEKGEKRHGSVHRIVAKTFIPNPNNYPMVNHIDGDKSNNAVSNLEWCTAGHNTRHAYKTGLANGDKIRDGRAQAQLRRIKTRKFEYASRANAMAREIMDAIDAGENYERAVSKIAKKYKNEMAL